MKKFTLHNLKTRAPKIPEYSCPVIDEIIAERKEKISPRRTGIVMSILLNF